MRDPAGFGGPAITTTSPLSEQPPLSSATSATVRTCVRTSSLVRAPSLRKSASARRRPSASVRLAGTEIACRAQPGGRAAEYTRVGSPSISASLSRLIPIFTATLTEAPFAEDFTAARAAAHPRSAKNELELLKRVLGDARGRGQRVDERVFGISPIRHRPRDGRPLTVPELYELASWFPEHSKRLVLLAGLVGSRQRVWFELTDDLLDLDEGTLSIPAWLAKRGKEHRVYLGKEERQLFREQLMIRARGTALVFPTPNGCQWNCSGFRASGSG